MASFSYWIFCVAYHEKSAGIAAEFPSCMMFDLLFNQ